MGSMTPDFGYYIGQSALSNFSHSLAGLFLACIPIGILLTYVLSFTGKYFSIIFPEPHRSAFNQLIDIEKITSIKGILLLLIAVFLGSLTHIAWDSFTHAGRWGVVNIDILKNEVFRIGALRFYGHSLLQYLSSIFGTGVILWTYNAWLKKNNRAFFSRQHGDYPRYKLIGLLILVSFSISLPIAYFHTKHISGTIAINAFVVDLAFTVTPVFFICALLSAFYLIYTEKF